MSGIQPQLPSNILDVLQIFANTAWHNPSAFRRTHQSSTSRNVEYLYLQDHSIALRYLFGSLHDQILVREEYREALQALQTDSAYEQGVYIIGQPGIGKTSFLIYALIERLSEHKPVAVQLRTSDPFYAFFTHTCTLHSLSDPSPLLQEEVWALSDLRVSTTTPLDIFLDVSVKVVQATLPSAKYWSVWSQYRGAEMYVMNIWSEDEVADLSSLLKIDVQHMTSLAVKRGGVPRMLMQLSKKSESQQDWELRIAATRFVDNYTLFLPALHSLNIQENDMGLISMIFFVLPLKDRTGNICHQRYDIRVPTVALENALAVALQQMQSKVKREDLLLLMGAHAGTRSCVKNIHMNWFYSLSVSQNAFRYSSNYSDSYLSSAISSIGAELPVIRGTLIRTNPPYFWIPPSGEFLGIDCVLVTRSTTHAIQVPTTFKPLSSSPQIGIDKLRKLLPTYQVSWNFFVFGTSEGLVLNASNHWRNLSGVSLGYWIADVVEIAIIHKMHARDDELTSEVEE